VGGALRRATLLSSRCYRQGRQRPEKQEDEGTSRYALPPLSVRNSATCRSFASSASLCFEPDSAFTVPLDPEVVALSVLRDSKYRSSEPIWHKLQRSPRPFESS